MTTNMLSLLDDPPRDAPFYDTQFAHSWEAELDELSDVLTDLLCPYNQHCQGVRGRSTCGGGCWTEPLCGASLQECVDGLRASANALQTLLDTERANNG